MLKLFDGLLKISDREIRLFYFQKNVEVSERHTRFTDGNHMRNCFTNETTVVFTKHTFSLWIVSTSVDRKPRRRGVVLVGGGD